MKVKITMKQCGDCQPGGGERWRDRGGVDGREGENAGERLVKINRVLRRAGRKA